jgi:hypothetical protein
LEQVREALEKELAMSQQVWPIELEELNLGTIEEPHNVLVARDLDVEFNGQLTKVLKEYKDVLT